MECHQCQNVFIIFSTDITCFCWHYLKLSDRTVICILIFNLGQEFYLCTEILFGTDIFFGYKRCYLDTNILIRYRHFIRIPTFYSDTDISFGHRHFIWILTFYSDTEIIFGYRHFIRIPTFYLDTNFLFGYWNFIWIHRHFIWIHTFYLDTNILFGYIHFIWIQTSPVLQRMNHTSQSLVKRACAQKPNKFPAFRDRLTVTSRMCCFFL